jgi:hypothetical protein
MQVGRLETWLGTRQGLAAVVVVLAFALVSVFLLLQGELPRAWARSPALVNPPAQQVDGSAALGMANLISESLLAGAPVAADIVVLGELLMDCVDSQSMQQEIHLRDGLGSLEFTLHPSGQLQCTYHVELPLPEPLSARRLYGTTDLSLAFYLTPSLDRLVVCSALAESFVSEELMEQQETLCGGAYRVHEGEAEWRPILRSRVKLDNGLFGVASRIGPPEPRGTVLGFAESVEQQRVFLCALATRCGVVSK